MKKVIVYTELQNIFENNYHSIREKEGYIYSDEIVSSLPTVSKEHFHSSQWKLRKQHAQMFCKYINRKAGLKNILELGCGNGWFSNQIALNTDAKVLGLDINSYELKQANRVFNRENLAFGYGDVFLAEFSQSFDLVVFNASIHYFDDFEAIITRVKELLSPSGEIHVLDTIFYANSKKVKEARNRTREYYKKMGNEGMAQFYFHHEVALLKDFEELHSPRKSWIFKLIKRQSSPFGWYRWKS